MGERIRHHKETRPVSKGPGHSQLTQVYVDPTLSFGTSMAFPSRGHTSTRLDVSSSLTGGQGPTVDKWTGRNVSEKSRSGVGHLVTLTRGTGDTSCPDLQRPPLPSRLFLSDGLASLTYSETKSRSDGGDASGTKCQLLWHRVPSSP